MNTIKNIFALVMLLCVFSCDSDTELEKSIYVPDPVSPDLPEYTEWGYNTFGAHYGRVPFVSNRIDVPLSVINHNDVTSFEFRGNCRTGFSTVNGTLKMTLVHSGFHPESYSDLIDLHDATFDLTDPEFQVVFTSESGSYQAQILNGSFHIKRAQYLVVDKQPTEVILSGVFEFQAIVNGEAVSVSDGRFDVGIGAINFFKY